MKKTITPKGLERLLRRLDHSLVNESMFRDVLLLNRLLGVPTLLSVKLEVVDGLLNLLLEVLSLLSAQSPSTLSSLFMDLTVQL